MTTETPIDQRHRIKKQLAEILANYIHEQGWTQTHAASKFGTTQPRVSELSRGKLNQFSIDTLAAYAANAGLRLEWTITKESDQ
jgi:predicted XRE-type DNA-binding protein